MAISGRKQSDNPVNPSNPRLGWAEVADVPYDGESPDLPDSITHAETVAWWEIVRHMPHCLLWRPSDWLFAVETARLVDDFWRHDVSDKARPHASELRLRSAKLGMTLEDRIGLRIRYVDAVPAEAPLAAVRSIDRSDLV